MGIINWVAFGGILVDLVIISMIVSYAYWGYRKGLVNVLFKILVFLLSLVLVFFLYKPVAKAIIDHTALDEVLAGAIEKNLSGTDIADGKLLDPSESNFSSAVVNLINSFVTEALQKANVDPMGYVSQNLAVFMIRVGTVLALLIISRFFLLFVRFAAELIASIPIIRTFNKSGGLVYGLVKGFFIVYLILAIFTVISPIISSWGIISSIQDSTIGSRMFNNNFIINLFLKDQK